jgi:hypothetical protein
LINSGKVALAKRMIVVEPVAQAFLELFTRKMAAKVMEIRSIQNQISPTA